VAAQILPFPNAGGATISPIACFLRIGEAHRKLADLHAAERLPARRVVIDASRFRYQQELISALREAGAEIVLDLKRRSLPPSQNAEVTPASPLGRLVMADRLGPIISAGGLPPTASARSRRLLWKAALTASSLLVIILGTRITTIGSLSTERLASGFAPRWIGRGSRCGHRLSANPGSGGMPVL